MLYVAVTAVLNVFIVLLAMSHQWSRHMRVLSWLSATEYHVRRHNVSDDVTVTWRFCRYDSDLMYLSMRLSMWQWLGASVDVTVTWWVCWCDRDDLMRLSMWQLLWIVCWCGIPGHTSGLVCISPAETQRVKDGTYLVRQSYYTRQNGNRSVRNRRFRGRAANRHCA